MWRWCSGLSIQTGDQEVPGSNPGETPFFQRKKKKKKKKKKKSVIRIIRAAIQVEKVE